MSIDPSPSHHFDSSGFISIGQLLSVQFPHPQPDSCKKKLPVKGSF